jgi:hypothetical protein
MAAPGGKLQLKAAVHCCPVAQCGSSTKPGRASLAVGSRPIHPQLLAVVKGIKSGLWHSKIQLRLTIWPKPQLGYPY